MQKIALLIIVFAFLALPGPAMAQEDSESVAEEAAQDELDSQPEEEAPEEAPEEEPEEEIVVDDEFYQDADDKDFQPSEDIPADQSIPFPTDI